MTGKEQTNGNVSKSWLLGVVLSALAGLVVLVANGAREAFIRLEERVVAVGMDVSAIKAGHVALNKTIDDAKADNARQFTAIWARIGTHP